MVLSVRIPERFDFGYRRDEVTFVEHRDAKSGEPLGEAGDTKGGGAHVDAAAIAAEIE